MKSQTQQNDQCLRRWAVGFSALGVASMIPVSLLQTGLVRDLPDPKIRGFNSRKVNLSDAAFPLGIPDGVAGLVSYAANIPLALAGPPDRAEKTPWIPAILAGKAGVELLAAGYYFYRMPMKEKAWCAYCVVGAVASVGAFACVLPEGLSAWRALRKRGRKHAIPEALEGMS